MSTKYQKKLDELLKLTSSDLNFKNLRNRVHTSDPPLVPFPGVYQGDLVFLDTSSKSRTENGLINFLKYQKIADNIGKLEMYQQKGFNLEMVPEILDYVEKYPALSDDDAYKDSLVCEPRV